MNVYEVWMKGWTAPDIAVAQTPEDAISLIKTYRQLSWSADHVISCVKLIYEDARVFGTYL